MNGEFTVINKPAEVGEDIVGTSITNDKVLVWTAKHWYLYNLSAELLAQVQKQPVSGRKAGKLYLSCDNTRCLLLKNTTTKVTKGILLPRHSTHWFLFHIYALVSISDCLQI